MTEGGVVRAIAICSACAVVIVALLHWRDMNHPACDVCDAVLYAADAASIQANGLWAPTPSRGMRTYGYPLFLSLILSPETLTPGMWGYYSSRLAVVQTILFISSAAVLCLAIAPISRTFAVCCAIGLLCNPIVLNYVPIRLTESLTATLYVLLCAVGCFATLHTSRPGIVALCLAIGGILAGAALVVRPANVGILVSWLAFSAFMSWRSGRLLPAVGAAIGAGIPIAPQIIINATLYGQYTPFSANDLGTLQMALGRHAVKYVTDLSGPIAHGLQYTYDGTLAPLAKVFHSINHDYFFTYVYDRSRWPSAPLNALNHVILFSAAAVAIAYRRERSLARLRAWLFPASAVACALAINAVVRPETRFGLLVFLTAGPIAVFGFARWRELEPRPRIAIAALCLLYATSASLLSVAFLP